jgi:hypothetical protein
MENYESLRDLVEMSNATISNELSSASISLNVMSVIIAVVGIAFSIYVSVLYNRVKKVREEVKNKTRYVYGVKKHVDEIKKQVDEVDSQIHSNLSGLYQQLREEETKTIINRLVEEPLDISNLDTLLLSRKIDDSLYPLLKEAFLKLQKTGRKDVRPQMGLSYNDKYLLLFFQHFYYNSIMDDDIRDVLPSSYGLLMRCAFKRDIIKSTEDLCRALSIDAVSFDRELFLYDYIVALNNSDFKNLIELKNILESQINNTALLPAAVERAIKNDIDLELFMS